MGKEFEADRNGKMSRVFVKLASLKRESIFQMSYG